MVLALCPPESSTRGILVDRSGVCFADGEWNLWKCSRSEDKFITKFQIFFLTLKKVTAEDFYSFDNGVMFYFNLRAMLNLGCGQGLFSVKGKILTFKLNKTFLQKVCYRVCCTKTFCQPNKWPTKNEIRMHSSRMRTDRRLTISWRVRGGGWCVWLGDSVSGQGVSDQLTPQEADQEAEPPLVGGRPGGRPRPPPPPWTEWHTPVKT